MADVCRTCQELDATVEVFDDTGQIELMLSVVIVPPPSREDNLPPRICEQCHSQLKIAYNFKIQAEETHRVLLDYILNPKESDDDVQPDVTAPEDSKPDSGLSVCDHCGKRVSRLKDHIRLHDPNRKRIPCGYCTKTFSTFDGRRKHRAVDHHGKLYFCRLCNKHYKNGYEHKRSTHSDVAKRHQCLFCDKTFPAKSILKYHLTEHTLERPFACTECNQSYREKNALQLHKRRVHKRERNRICHYCSKAFFSAYSLNVHMRLHTKEKNYKCIFCEKSFTTATSMKNHERRHTGAKFEECEHCKLSFVTKSALKTHMVTHTGERNYECQHCGMKFGRSDNRNRHVKVVHGEK